MFNITQNGVCEKTFEVKKEFSCIIFFNVNFHKTHSQHTCWLIKTYLRVSYCLYFEWSLDNLTFVYQNYLYVSDTTPAISLVFIICQG